MHVFNIIFNEIDYLGYTSTFLLINACSVRKKLCFSTSFANTRVFAVLSSSLPLFRFTMYQSIIYNVHYT